MIVMDTQSQLTMDIISKVALGKISMTNASKLLNKSRRTIERYLRRHPLMVSDLWFMATQEGHPLIKYPLP